MSDKYESDPDGSELPDDLAMLGQQLADDAHRFTAKYSPRINVDRAVALSRETRARKRYGMRGSFLAASCLLVLAAAAWLQTKPENTGFGLTRQLGPLSEPGPARYEASDSLPAMAATQDQTPVRLLDVELEETVASSALSSTSDPLGDQMYVDGSPIRTDDFDSHETLDAADQNIVSAGYHPEANAPIEGISGPELEGLLDLLEFEGDAPPDLSL